jgi:hypothetical protein
LTIHAAGPFPADPGIEVVEGPTGPFDPDKSPRIIQHALYLLQYRFEDVNDAIVFPF